MALRRFLPLLWGAVALSQVLVLSAELGNPDPSLAVLFAAGGAVFLASILAIAYATGRMKSFENSEA